MKKYLLFIVIAFLSIGQILGLRISAATENSNTLSSNQIGITPVKKSLVDSVISKYKSNPRTYKNRMKVLLKKINSIKSHSSYSTFSENDKAVIAYIQIIAETSLTQPSGTTNQTIKPSTQNQIQAVNQIGKQINVGAFSGYTYYTTPGNCTDSTTPVCDGKNDTMMKVWSTETVMRNATSTTDGKVNTTLIIALPNASEYPAIKYCANMVYATHDDWYLPAKDELNILYSNKDTIQGFDLTNIIYWSSTEENYFSPWYQAFKYGTQGFNQFGVVKGETGLIRCIRKE